ncbi:MAG TPA: hypothetical protein VF487_06050 [Chitinophagaceae bacterium]
MKFFLTLHILLFAYGCNNARIDSNCEKIDTILKNSIASYYEYDSLDTLSIEPIAARWKRLSQYLCSKIKFSQKFYIVEIAGKEGLLYDIHSKKFHLFKRNGSDIILKFWGGELKEMHSFILKLAEQPKEYLDEIKKKTKNVATYDAPNVSILYVDLEEEIHSYFFSMGYSDYLLGTGDK